MVSGVQPELQQGGGCQKRDVTAGGLNIGEFAVPTRARLYERHHGSSPEATAGRLCPKLQPALLRIADQAVDY